MPYSMVLVQPCCDLRENSDSYLWLELAQAYISWDLCGQPAPCDKAEPERVLYFLNVSHCQRGSIDTVEERTFAAQQTNALTACLATHDCPVLGTCAECTGSNVYFGLSDDGGTDGVRHPHNNRRIDSTTVGDLKLKWKFDINRIFNVTGATIFGRLSGPLTQIQVDEERVYFVVGATIIELPQTGCSTIVALNRTDGSLIWYRCYADVSTEAQHMLAQKYPTQYDVDAVEQWQRTMGGVFGPFTLHGDYIYTGDGTTSIELDTAAYVAAQPHIDVPNVIVDGAGNTATINTPVLPCSRGVTNANRHLLRTTAMVLDKRTGALKAVDRFADSGAPEGGLPPSQRDLCVMHGALWRMPTLYDDPVDGQTYMVVGNSAQYPAAALNWTLLDTTSLAQANAGWAAGNRLTWTSRVQRWRVDIDTSANAVNLQMTWVRYANPPPFYAGDTNPVTGETFENDTAASEYNYAQDGIWAQRPLIDYGRRQIVISNSNGIFTPKEDVQTAWTLNGAEPSHDPITGAQSYPNRTYYDWFALFRAQPPSNEHVQRVSRDYDLTQRDRVAALYEATALHGSRWGPASDGSHDGHWADAIVALDLDTGAYRWKYARTAIDNYVSETLLARYIPGLSSTLAFTVDKRAAYLSWMFAGEGGDLDYGSGPVHAVNPQIALDVYVVAGKQGTIQGLDPDTGAVVYYSNQLTYPNAIGGFNYGVTFDGMSSVFAATVAGMTVFDAISSVSHNSSVLCDASLTQCAANFTFFNPNKIIPPGFPGNLAPLPILYPDWESQLFFDAHGDVDPAHPGRWYAGQKIIIPANTSYFVRADAATGIHLGDVPRRTYSNGTAFALSTNYYGDNINTNTFSVNDVVFMNGASSGRIYAYHTSTLQQLWQYNGTLGDLLQVQPVGVDASGFPTTGSATYLYADSAIAAAGGDVFAAIGEQWVSRVAPLTPGRFVYRFSLD